MIIRCCKGLANTFAWSSSRDGRWILPLILVVYFLTLAALTSSRNLVSAWETLGVSAGVPSFLDTRFVTATMDSQRLGHDPYIENPCDPYRRPMNYPRIWLALASFGLTQDHTVIVGVGLALIFLGCLLCWAGQLNPAQSLIFGIFLCSPRAMWMIERGNVDMVIFILLASSLVLVRRCPKMRPVLYVSIMFSSILKLYPIAGMLVVGRDKPWRVLAWGLIIPIAFFAYIFFTWPDLILVIRANRYLSSSWWSYGRIVIFDTIGSYIHARAGVEIPPSFLALSSLVAVGIALFIASLWANRIDVVPMDTDHLDSFVIGSGIYIGTFLIGTNFDYKLIFLVLLLPQLFDWIQNRGELVRTVYLLLTFLMLSIWGEFLLGRIRHRPVWNPPVSGILLQDLASWLLFVLVLALNIVIMRGWVKRWVRHSKGTAGVGIIGKCGASTGLLLQRRRLEIKADSFS